MINLRQHAALSDKERARLHHLATSAQRAAERMRAELLLADAALVVMREFGEHVERIVVHTGPCHFGGQAVVSEIVAADGSILWAALRRGHPLGKPWAGEDEALEHISRAWRICREAFRPVDDPAGLYEIRLHRGGRRS